MYPEHLNDISLFNRLCCIPFQDVWNMDETGLSTVQSKVGKVISLRGLKKVGSIMSQERGTLVTMALGVNASGAYIPPFFVYPRKNMRSYYMNQAPQGAMGVSNESGWMQQNEFYLLCGIPSSAPRQPRNGPPFCCWIIRLTFQSRRWIWAYEHDIVLLSFPPHCSHRMQPLDVSVFGPVKAYYNSQCAMWARNHTGRAFEIEHIPAIRIMLRWRK